MRRSALLAVLAAWIMLQVPLVVCASTCKASVGALFLMGGHACHDESSPVHEAHCHRGCRHAPAPATSGERHDEDGHDEDGHDEDGHDEEGGDHALVILASGAGASVPALLVAPAPAEADASPPALAPRLVARAAAPRAAHGPPGRDPVAAADRLLV